MDFGISQTLVCSLVSGYFNQLFECGRVLICVCIQNDSCLLGILWRINRYYIWTNYHCHWYLYVLKTVNTYCLSLFMKVANQLSQMRYITWCSVLPHLSQWDIVNLDNFLLFLTVLLVHGKPYVFSSSVSWGIWYQSSYHRFTILWILILNSRCFQTKTVMLGFLNENS